MCSHFMYDISTPDVLHGHVGKIFVVILVAVVVNSNHYFISSEDILKIITTKV